MGSLDKALAYYQDRLYFNIPFTFSSLHEYLNLENFLMKIQFTQPLIIFTLSCIFSSLRLIFLLLFFFFIACSILTQCLFEAFIQFSLELFSTSISVCHKDSKQSLHLWFKEIPDFFYIQRNLEINTSRNIWTLLLLIAFVLQSMFGKLESPVMIQLLVLLISLITLQRSLFISRCNPEGLQQTPVTAPLKLLLSSFPYAISSQTDSTFYTHQIIFVLYSHQVISEECYSR